MNKWQKEDPNYQSEKLKYPNPVPSRGYILSKIKHKPFSFNGLAKTFNLNRNEKETLKHRIKAMLRDGELELSINDKIRIPKSKPILIGKVFAHTEGYGFFIPNDKSLTKGEDLFLSYREMRNVMHGDAVEAKILNYNRKGKVEGKIIKVTKHANKVIIGKLEDEFGIKVVKAENKRIHQKILVTNINDIKAEKNNIVEVEITSYPQNNQPIIGKITRVLGNKLDSGMEIDIALISHNIPNDWPENVAKQTVAIQDIIPYEEYESRVDLRDIPFITIDGITAKDFDDAVFARKTNKGYMLYVAIADVSHYVRKDSPLDIEAINRATSVYFPNRVIPMLPEKLSNGLCSLNPDVDRLCIVCEMLIDNFGVIKRSRFYEAIMKSHARMTYEKVEDILFNKTVKISNKKDSLLPQLKSLKDLYLILKEQRKKRGAINFNTKEAEFEYDSNGKIDRIFTKKKLKSHQLIEEFMVRANICAGKFLLKNKGKNKPIALFRNHQGPPKEKLDNLIETLSIEGVKIKKHTEILPIHLSKIIEQTKERDDFESLQILILRSMHQAIYQPDNDGHFGLALEYYAHFTSPIRRYPDLLVHRAIKHKLKYNNELYIYSYEQMKKLGEQCSMAERRADDAVYDVIGFLKCEYLSDKLGQHYKASISGITNFGIFATLDNHFIDGLIHISSLNGDYFNFDEKKNILIGEKSHKSYKIGDKVEIIISNINIDDRRIEFILTDKHLPFSGKQLNKKSKKVNKKHRKNK